MCLMNARRSRVQPSSNLKCSSNNYDSISKCFRGGKPTGANNPPGSGGWKFRIDERVEHRDTPVIVTVESDEDEALLCKQ